MTKTGFLKVSTIQNSTVKKIAEKSNTETKNDTIDTQNEWKSFLNGIAYAFSTGDITYDEAKKYVNLSSSIFSSEKNVNKGYTEGFLEGLDMVHDMFSSRIARKIITCLDKIAGNENLNAKTILTHAELEEIKIYEKNN